MPLRCCRVALVATVQQSLDATRECRHQRVRTLGIRGRASQTVWRINADLFTRVTVARLATPGASIELTRVVNKAARPHCVPIPMSAFSELVTKAS